jgi:anti-sigma factor RsiW
MKLHPDDPRLTAYLLGELPADESAAVARAAAADPAIGLALRELESVQRLLTNTLAPATSALLPHQRDTVIRMARHADLADKVVQLASQRRSWKSFLVPLAVAAVIALATFLLLNSPATDPGKLVQQPEPPKPENWDQIPLEIALLPAPGPPDASIISQTTGTGAGTLAAQTAARDTALAKTGDAFLQKVTERLQQNPSPPAAALPPLTRRGSVPTVISASLPLPIHSGRASLSWITQAIRGTRQLPSPNAVRLEEILNNFNLRLVGTAAIAQGVSITTESLPCPWKPSATLLLVALRGDVNAAREVTATYHAAPAAVSLFRLLGFATVTGVKPGPLPSRLPAKAITTLAIEIEPAVFSTELGTIEWSVDGKPAAPVPVPRHSAAEPSDDARFGALLCTFGQWLAREQPDLVDSDLLASLARESTTPTLPPNRADLVKLIDQALKLPSGVSPR